jgi:hypothetical protein
MDLLIISIAIVWIGYKLNKINEKLEDHDEAIKDIAEDR